MSELKLEGWNVKEPAEALLTREWLVTNGLGGYASGTLAGVTTRRFHGLLIAALPAPAGRIMMFNHLEECIRVGGRAFRLSGDERPGAAPVLPHPELLDEFWLDLGIPVWRFETDEIEIEKRITMPYRQNTTVVQYHLRRAAAPISLELRPSLHFRPHEGLLSGPTPTRYELTDRSSHWEISAGAELLPSLRLSFAGVKAELAREEQVYPELLYRIEQSRGYDHAGQLWTPGTFQLPISPGETLTLIASAEPWEVIEAVAPDRLFSTEQGRMRQLLSTAKIAEQPEMVAQLALAADQFVITPTRLGDRTRAYATGEEPRSVIAGYHWFTDWGRDTMISLEGLTLTTGRYREAGSILRTFASYVRDGLIPNMFPEGANEGVYHTADATLWFFHAIDRYVQITGNSAMLQTLLPTLVDIIDHHLRGTRFGIGVDPADGLLRQGAEGYQLTWMDAKVDGWVVTPRRGKAVEINALFYNALRLLERWLQEANDPRAVEIGAHAARAKKSFNERFWYQEGGYLYDVVDGEGIAADTSLRPNQIFSLSLPHEVLDPARWEAVVETVRRELLTPVGLRSLGRNHPDYKPTYDGDLRSRDAAYHQGTVWGWLIGPFVDAWLKVHPDEREGARRLLEGMESHLREACIGSISEIFDAEEPFAARGCVAQAWSVAEVLRCLVKVRPAP